MMTRVGKPLNPNRIGEPQDLKEGFALHVPDRSQVIDSKRRDVGVVDRVRLENVALDQRIEGDLLFLGPAIGTAL